MLATFLRHVNTERIQPMVIFFQRGPFEREVAALGIETLVIPTGRLRQVWDGFRVARELGTIMRRTKPDLLMNWSAKTHLYGASGAFLAGMADRVIWWQQGIPDRHWLDRLATLLPARAIGCYSGAAAEAQARLRPRRSTFIVHPGVDPVHVTANASQLRQQLMIPKQRLVLGIVGRLQPWKGQHRFICALDELRKRGHDVHGLIVGGDAWNLSPDYEPYLRRLTSELNMNEAITFTGQVTDGAGFISAMDVLVNASMPEPFGIVLIEAMALGVPVVAVDVGGPAEIIESDRSGLLVPESTPGALADALEQLIEDPVRRRQLGDGARERYLDRFTAKRMAESLQRELEEVVQNLSPRDASGSHAHSNRRGV
jgi:glycosyltransferase involved in cell wall biosynthesis